MLPSIWISALWLWKRRDEKDFKGANAEKKK